MPSHNFFLQPKLHQLNSWFTKQDLFYIRAHVTGLRSLIISLSFIHIQCIYNYMNLTCNNSSSQLKSFLSIPKSQKFIGRACHHFFSSSTVPDSPIIGTHFRTTFNFLFDIFRLNVGASSSTWCYLVFVITQGFLISYISKSKSHI